MPHQILFKAEFHPDKNQFLVEAGEQGAASYRSMWANPSEFETWVTNFTNSFTVADTKFVIDGNQANAQIARAREYFELVLDSYKRAMGKEK